MRQLLIFILFFIIIFIGCAPKNIPLLSPFSSNNAPIQTTVYIDRAFSPSEETDITNAFKSIECSTNYMVRFKIFYNADYESFKYADIKTLFIWKTDNTDTRIITANKTLPKEKDGVNRIVVGLYLVGDGDHPNAILIVGNKINGNLREITIHEVFHFLGMGHSEDHNSIMYPHMDLGANKITDLDIKKICDIYHIDPAGMRSCDIK